MILEISILVLGWGSVIYESKFQSFTTDFMYWDKKWPWLWRGSLCWDESPLKHCCLQSSVSWSNQPLTLFNDICSFWIQLACIHCLLISTCAELQALKATLLWLLECRANGKSERFHNSIINVIFVFYSSQDKWIISWMTSRQRIKVKSSAGLLDTLMTF